MQWLCLWFLSGKVHRDLKLENILLSEKEENTEEEAEVEEEEKEEEEEGEEEEEEKEKDLGLEDICRFCIKVLNSDTDISDVPHYFSFFLYRKMK